jgi:hypothetical protein
MYSKGQLRIIETYNQGYRVDLTTGEIISPRGTRLDAYPCSGDARRGYPQFSVTVKNPELMMAGRREKNDGRVNVMVHKFIAFCLWGEDSFNCQVIRHLDDNKKNSHPSNLAMGTHKDNARDRIDNYVKRIGLWETRFEVVEENASTETWGLSNEYQQDQEEYDEGF